MRKLYFLSLLFLSFVAFSQGSIDFDTDANWSPTPSGYGDYTYTDGVFTATGVDVLRNTTAVQDGFDGALGTYSVRLRNNSTTSLTMVVASGGIGTFSFQVRRWDSSPDTNFQVETSIDNGTTWNISSTINATITSDSDWKTVSGTINSSNADVAVRIVSLGTTERIMVDNFVWTTPSSDPTLTISSPSNGTVFDPMTTAVDVGLNISNFQVGATTAGLDGHIHYVLTTDGTAGTQVMKYDDTPINLTVAAGSDYSLYVELVDNTHTAISPAVNVTVTFSVADFTGVTDLAALRADYIADPAAGADKYYQVATAPVITYSRANRNQKYIQDTSAGIVIDDDAAIMPYNDGTGTGPVDGDALSGLVGQVTTYGGVLQFVPVQAATVASSGNVITPEVVTIADITANQANYESELVQITGVTFTEADGTIVFETTDTSNPGPNYDISDSSGNMIFRTLFSEADYLTTTTVVPTAATDLVVLVAQFNGTPQVVARSIADIETLDTKAFNAIDGLTMYPNPVANGATLNITTTNTSDMTVQIFNILGKEVHNTTVNNNTIEISNLNSGVYMVKITQDGKTATRKLVVQ